MSQTRIAVDADQVLFDFASAWRSTAEDLLERPLQQCGHSYHLMARYQLSMSEYHRCWREFHRRKIWRDCPVFPKALATVRSWLLQNMDQRLDLFLSWSLIQKDPLRFLQKKSKLSTNPVI